MEKPEYERISDLELRTTEIEEQVADLFEGQDLQTEGPYVVHNYGFPVALSRNFKTGLPSTRLVHCTRKEIYRNSGTAQTKDVMLSASGMAAGSTITVFSAAAGGTGGPPTGTTGVTWNQADGSGALTQPVKVAANQSLYMHYSHRVRNFTSVAWLVS